MAEKIGIDLDTTNTIVSYVNRNGRLRQLRFGREEVIPSVIHFKSKDEYFIGGKALKRFLINPKAEVKDFLSNIDSSGRIEIIPDEGEPFELSARDIARLFLNKIIAAFDDVIDLAVIAVPWNFNNTQKEAVREVACEAGIVEVKITSSACAAVRATVTDAFKKKILVVNLGAGTFEVSVADCDSETVIAADNHLGISSFDEFVYNYLIELVQEDCGIDVLDDLNREHTIIAHSVRGATKLAREDLSDDGYFEYSISNLGGRLLEFNLTREDFYAICQPVYDRITGIIERCLRFRRTEIDSVCVVCDEHVPLEAHFRKIFPADMEIEFHDRGIIARGACLLSLTN